MATGRNTKQSRAERDRTRLYQARREFHERGKRRRTRDNLIAGFGGGILIVGLVTAQTLYFTAGPGIPEPTVTAVPAPVETTVPAPEVTDLPIPVPTVSTPVEDSDGE